MTRLVVTIIDGKSYYVNRDGKLSTEKYDEYTMEEAAIIAGRYCGRIINIKDQNTIDYLD